MSKKNEVKNDFEIAINIRCEPEEFEVLLKKAKINYFKHHIEHPVIYYDEQTYFVFQTKETRQSFIKKVNDCPEIIVEINEITFCQLEE